MLLVNANSGPSQIHRLGLFANESISAGHKIAEYRQGFDLALTQDEVSGLPFTAREQFLKHAFFHQVSARYLCDGDDGRFTNHADNPNTRQIDLASYAIRDIPSGTEITLDYNELGAESPTEPPGIAALPATNGESRHGWVINGQTGLYLDRTSVGWGVFASKPFAVGEHLLTFIGSELTLPQTLALGQWSMYPVQTGVDRYLDCEPPGAFINHSCSPSAALARGPRLVALRGIAVGEELTMDYSCSMSGDPESGMPCRCGSPRCRGLISNFEELPAALREELLKRNMVTGFIAALHTTER